VISFVVYKHNKGDKQRREEEKEKEENFRLDFLSFRPLIRLDKK
jgi:hypothetical protein